MKSQFFGEAIFCGAITSAVSAAVTSYSDFSFWTFRGRNFLRCNLLCDKGCWPTDLGRAWIRRVWRSVLTVVVPEDCL